MVMIDYGVEIKLNCLGDLKEMKLAAKRVLKALLINFIFFNLFSSLALANQNFYSPNISIASESVLLINNDTNQIIYEKNATKKVCISGLAGLMTTLVALDVAKEGNLSEFLKRKVVAKPIIYDALYRKNTATADIRPNEELPMIDLLYAVNLTSSNEAARIIAEVIDGSNMAAFVEKMNNKAKQLGMKETKYVDPDGLDESARTTAQDQFKLISHCFKIPIMQKILSARTYEMHATNMHSEREIYRNNFKPNGKIGNASVLKTGSFEEGFNLICSAKKNSYTYTAFVFASPKTGKTHTAFEDATAIFEWAFNDLKFVTVAIPGKTLIPNYIRVKWGSKRSDNLNLNVKSPVILLLPKSIDATAIYWDCTKLPTKINAPIGLGQQIGSVDVKLSNRVLKKVDVISGEAISLNYFEIVVSIVKILFSWWVLAVVILIGIVLKWIKVVRKRNRIKKIKSREKNRIKHKKYRPNSIKFGRSKRKLSRKKK